MPNRPSLRTVIFTSVAMLCFAANSILCRLALGPALIDAATFTTLRVLSAAAMLSLMVWLSYRRLPHMAAANPRAVVALFGYLVFFSFAYRRLAAGFGGVCPVGARRRTRFTHAAS